MPIKKTVGESNCATACCTITMELYRLPVEYALQGMTKPMGVSTYRTSPEMPKELAGLLPSIESLTAQLDAEVIEISDSDPTK